MRSLWIFACLPLFAAVPLKVQLLDPAVTWGAGREPQGALPTAHFETRIRLTGSKLPVHPVFRAWRVKIGAYPQLDTAKSLRLPLDPACRLTTTATARPGGTWELAGAWPEAPDAEDRLVVEVWEGNRRLGWAASRLTEHFLQTTGPRPGTQHDD